VTHDDVADVAQAEATEDMQLMGAWPRSKMRTSTPATWRCTASAPSGWLALFVGQTITIVVLGSFQDQLDQAPGCWCSSCLW
jgi:Mg/Co/Ni transporter MgtE